MNVAQTLQHVAFLRQLVDVPGTNTSSWEVKGLTTGARYSFTVQSYNQQGRPYHTSPPVEVLMRGTSSFILLGALHYRVLFADRRDFSVPFGTLKYQEE